MSAPNTYLALLRGINVGGNNMIRMADLKKSLVDDGFENVRTYIQTGNIIFESNEKDATKLAKNMSKHIKSEYKADVTTVVLTKDEYTKIINSIPKSWGKKEGWKYNLLFLIPPYDEHEIVAGIGTLKPEMEEIIEGKGVLYQSISIKLFGRATSGKLASMPVYKQITIRNLNTGRKILDLMNS